MKSLKKGEKKKMKTSSKLKILLSILLIATIIASGALASTMPSTSGEKVETPSGGVATETVAPLEIETENPVVLGPAGSGWKPDVKVTGTSTTEVNPSMATYIDPTTGAVTLYVASQVWRSDYGQWVIYINRSFNRGDSWSLWRINAWSGRDAINPSIAVSPYNGTVWVATESYSPLTNNDILMFRNEPKYWTGYTIDGDNDDDRNPHLVSEYSFGTGNWLYCSYEFYWDFDDRDLYVARSTDWGKTWWTQVLRGGAGQPDTPDVFVQSDIAYVQRNVYIAYRHSADYYTPGHIEVMYSTDYGTSYKGPFDASPTTKIDAWWPSITGSHVGPSHQPTTLWVAYQNASVGPTSNDIFACWSKDYGDTWSIPQLIAGSSYSEEKPRLSVDGMGTESLNVPGYIHLVYFTNEIVGARIGGIYYTQVAYHEPCWAYYPQAIYYYSEGWSTPQGQIIDNNGYASWSYNTPTVTTFTRPVGGETLWMPGVAWTDYRNPSYDIYYTTLDTMFSVSVLPTSQTVEAGKSLSFYVTVSLISGTTATATLDITGPLTYHMASAHVWGHSFNPPTVTPTATSILTFNTANYLGPGTHYVNASAVIGGYRRHATITFTATAPPTLTLDLSTSTARRNITAVTFSGQLTPGISTTVYILYRKPHETGSWKKLLTVATNPSGAYSVTYTFPAGKPLGQYDIVAFWVQAAKGSYATSPIKVLTLTL